MKLKVINLKVVTLLLGILIVVLSNTGYSIPSYARQTNLACGACHYVYPELTPFGRLFKLNGYTMTGIATIKSTYKEDNTNLQLLNILPLSAMIQGSYNKIAKTIPGTQNDVTEFPQQFSLFVAGAISPNFGSFIQITYDDQSGSFSLDNTDLRFADHTTLLSNDLLYGITLNNNPTVQDVWNTTPAWGFPFVGSAVAPTPSADPIIAGLGGQVSGLGAYALYNNLIYGEFSLYHVTKQGGPIPETTADKTMTMAGYAPYWRVALQQQWENDYLEIGTYGIASQFYPTGISDASTDKYTDIGFDAQYEKTFDSGTFIAHTTYLTEKQNLDATYLAGGSANPSLKLNSFKVDANYNLPVGVAFSLGYFTTNGDQDAVVYASNNSFSPNSAGLTAQVTYLPWLNTQFAVQYVAYNKFNGSSSNYDGTGRNASDNNTLYVVGWVSF
ncbi:MAG: cytochrome C [Ignavibacteriaceae bacterium]